MCQLLYLCPCSLVKILVGSWLGHTSKGATRLTERLRQHFASSVCFGVNFVLPFWSAVNFQILIITMSVLAGVVVVSVVVCCLCCCCKCERAGWARGQTNLWQWNLVWRRRWKKCVCVWGAHNGLLFCKARLIPPSPKACQNWDLTSSLNVLWNSATHLLYLISLVKILKV